MLDQYNREISYLRLSITDACTLHCPYCRGKNSEKPFNFLSEKEIEKIARVAIDLGINKIRLTGGEPLLHPDIVSICNKINSINGLKELTLTTNGQLLEKLAKPLFDAGVHRVNISVDSLNPKTYKAITGGELSRTLKGIEKAKSVGMEPIKLNTVLLKGINDREIKDFLEFGKEQGLDVRFIELMPMGNLAKKPQLRLTQAELIEKFPSQKISRDSFSPSTKWVTEENEKFGLISPMTKPFCSSCNRIRILSDGVVKPCLGCSEEYSIKEYLDKSDEILKEKLEDIIFHKPKKYQMEDYKIPKRDMSRIGG